MKFVDYNTKELKFELDAQNIVNSENTTMYFDYIHARSFDNFQQCCYHIKN